MIERSLTSRRFANRALHVFAAMAALIGCALLGWVLITLLIKGGAALNWDLITQPQVPPGVPHGGLGPAIVGTLLITGLAAAVGIPLGLLAGVYMAEFGRGSRLARTVRFAADVLFGVPSILVGVFVYAILVEPFSSGNGSAFSGFAGAAALAIMIIPIVARTSEDMLRMVPDSLREAASALGAERWRVALGVACRAAKAGILTGVLLSVARVSGETAPLLWTALNSPYGLDLGSFGAFVNSFNSPTANMTVTIYHQALTPYPDWERIAWGGALLITGGVLVVTIVSRLILRERKSR